MTDLQLAPKNHNSPPSELELLEQDLTLRHVHLMRDAEARAKLAQNIPEIFTEQNEADFTTDFIKEVTVLQKSLDSARKEEKEPFLRQGQMVDGFFGSYIKSLDESIERAKLPLTAWLKKQAAEEQKRRDAEAARLREEAAKAVQNIVTEQDMEKAVQAREESIIANKVAAVPMQTMAAATGKYSKAGLKKEWVGTITDIGKVDLEKLRAYIKPEALQVALNAYVKMGGRDCAGCVIEETVKVGVR